jgi:hypothetical protein
MHPLQLDVIERAVTLWSNPGETVFSPFAGVGSELWGAVRMGRRGLGCELKPTYFRQALRNLQSVDEPDQERMLFDLSDDDRHTGTNATPGVDLDAVTSTADGQ